MHRILVVDDEPVVRKGIAFIIEHCAPEWVEVAQAESATEALRLMENSEFHLIVTDIHMPEMNGLQFLTEVRLLSPDIRGIIISGYNDFDYTRRALQLNCLDYLVKPVKKEELEEMVRKVVRLWEEENRARKKLDETEQLADQYRFRRLLNGEFDTVAEMYDCASALGLYPKAQMIAMLTLEVETRSYQLPLYLFAGELFREIDASVYRIDNDEVIVLMRHDNEDEADFWAGSVRQAERLLARWRLTSQAQFRASLCLLRDVSEFPSCRRKAKQTREGQTEWLTLQLLEAGHDARSEVATPAIRKALRMIEERFDQELSATGVANAVHLNPDYFSWLFHKEVGKTYTEHVTEIRMERAKQLLAERSIPAYEVAEKTGYQSVRNFNRVFKAWVGLSPIEFRKKYQANVQQDPG